MKRFILYYSAILAASFAFASASVAQTASATPVAVVNIQRLMSDSTSAKSVREQLENKQKSFQTEISKKQEALQKEDQELGKQRSVLAKEEFEKKAAAFRTKVTDVQKEVQSKKTLLDNASARSWEDVQKTVAAIVADIAKAKNYSVVIGAMAPTAEVLYADSKVDITDEVLAQLNKKLPKVDVKF